MTIHLAGEVTNDFVGSGAHRVLGEGWAGFGAGKEVRHGNDCCVRWTEANTGYVVYIFKLGETKGYLYAGKNDPEQESTSPQDHFFKQFI